MSDNRLEKIFGKTVYRLAKDTKIPKSVLYRYNEWVPKVINMKLMKKLADHSDLTVGEFLKRYVG